MEIKHKQTKNPYRHRHVGEEMTFTGRDMDGMNIACWFGLELVEIIPLMSSHGDVNIEGRVFGT